MGTLSVQPDGNQITGHVPFRDGDQEITITDRRAGNLPWFAEAAASALVSAEGNTIDPRFLGLESVHVTYVPGNALNEANPVVPHDLPTADGGVPGATGLAPGLRGEHVFASAAHGNGTVFVGATLWVRAPTSTRAGHYTGTITFTVS